MISGMSGVASSYLRPASTFTSNPTLTPADALTDASATTDSETSAPRINVSQLKPLQGAKFISAADDPVAISTIGVHAGDVIYSLRIDGANFGVELEPNFWYSLAAGERIISANGRHGWQCHQLQLATNMTQNAMTGRSGDVIGGRRDPGARAGA